MRSFPEVRGINKQKFLTELGRLLTFMHEEDRERALNMYSSLFEETDDETGLLQMLGSPTRQAVNLARSYDARERRLQMQAQSRGEAPAGGEPSFVRMIGQLRTQAAALGAPVSKISADQFSLFESAGKETALFDELETQSAPVEEPAPAFEDFAAPAEEPAPAAPSAPGESGQFFTEEAVAVDPLDALLAQYARPDYEPVSNEPVQEAAPAEEAEPAPIMRPVPPQAQEERQGSMPGARPAPLPPPVYENERAQADFGFTPAAPAAAAPAPVPEQVPAAPEPIPEPVPAAPAAPVRTESTHSAIRAGARPVFTVSKPRVGLLILFLLFAVPITLLCVLVLLLPAALALGAAGFAGWLGFAGLTATFGSFTVFADILLVFGCTLIVLALALLFLWIFIWLLGGAIPGLIRGVCALARKWCYKEVPVQ